MNDGKEKWQTEREKPKEHRLDLSLKSRISREKRPKKREKSEHLVIKVYVILKVDGFFGY